MLKLLASPEKLGALAELHLHDYVAMEAVFSQVTCSKFATVLSFSVALILLDSFIWLL